MNSSVQENERSAQVHDLIRARMEKDQIPGLSLAVARHGVPLILQGYGFANLEHDVPATPDTLYEIASVSKQFVATAIMILADEGRLTLDDPITGYFRNSPTTWQPITIRHLLSHSSGLVRDGLPDYWNDPAAMHLDYEYSQMFEIIAGRELDFETGEKSSYSNSGYFLTGLIIEQVTGQTLNEVLTERIFAPLGMSATRINDPLAILPHRAGGYTPINKDNPIDAPKGWRKLPYIGLRHHFANGGLVSTVRDLVKWDATLYTEQLLPQVRLQELWTPYLLNDGTSSDYGLGWAVGNYEGHQLIQHSGGLPGFTTYVCRFLDDELTVIALTNTEFPNSSAGLPALGKEVAKLYFE